MTKLTTLEAVQTIGQALIELNPAAFNPNLSTPLFAAMGYLASDRKKGFGFDADRFDMHAMNKAAGDDTQSRAKIAKMMNDQSQWKKAFFNGLLLQQNFQEQKLKDTERLPAAVDCLLASEKAQSQDAQAIRLPQYALYQLGLLFSQHAEAFAKMKEGRKSKTGKRKTYLQTLITQLTHNDYPLHENIKAMLKSVWETYTQTLAQSKSKHHTADRAQAFKQIGDFFRHTAAINGHLIAKVEVGTTMIEHPNKANEGISLISSACQMIAEYKLDETHITSNQQLDGIYHYAHEILTKHGSPAASLQLAMLDNPLTDQEAMLTEGADKSGNQALVEHTARARAQSAAKKAREEQQTISHGLSQQFFEKAKSVDERLNHFASLVLNLEETVKQWAATYRDDVGRFKKLSNHWASIVFGIIADNNKDLLIRPAMVTHVQRLIALTHDETRAQLSQNFLEQLSLSAERAQSPEKRLRPREKTMKPKVPASPQQLQAISVQAGESYCELLVSHLTSPERLAQLSAAKQRAARTLSLIGLTLAEPNLNELVKIIRTHATVPHHGATAVALSQTASSVKTTAGEFKNEIDLFENRLRETLRSTLTEICHASGAYEMFESLAQAEAADQTKAEKLAKNFVQTSLLPTLVDKITQPLDELLKNARADMIIASAKTSIENALGEQGTKAPVINTIRQALVVADFDPKKPAEFAKNIRRAASEQIKATFGATTKGSPQYKHYEQAKQFVDSAINEALKELKITETKTGSSVLGGKKTITKFHPVKPTHEILKGEPIQKSLSSHFTTTLSTALEAMAAGFATHAETVKEILAGNPIPMDADAANPTQQLIFTHTNEALQRVRFSDAEKLDGYLKNFLFHRGNAQAKFIGLAETLAARIGSLDSDRFPDRLFWRRAMLNIFLENVGKLNTADVMGPLTRLVLTTQNTNVMETMADAVLIMTALDKSLYMPSMREDIVALELLADLAHIKLNRNTKSFAEHREREVQRYITQMRQNEDGTEIEGKFSVETCNTIRAHLPELDLAKTNAAKALAAQSEAKQLLSAQRRSPDEFGNDAAYQAHLAKSAEQIKLQELAYKNATEEATAAVRAEDALRDNIEEPVREMVDGELRLSEAYVSASPTLIQSLDNNVVHLSKTALPLLANTTMGFPADDDAEQAVERIVGELAKDFNNEALQSGQYQFKNESEYDFAAAGLGEKVGELQTRYIEYRQAADRASAWMKYHRQDVDFAHSREHVVAKAEEKNTLNALKAVIREAIFPLHDLEFVPEDFQNETAAELSPEMQAIISHLMLLDNPHLAADSLSDTQRNHELKRLYDKMDLSLKQGLFMRAALLNNSKQLFTLHERTTNIVLPDLIERLNPELPLSLQIIAMSALAQHLSQLGENKASLFNAWFIAEILVAHIKHVDQLDGTLVQQAAFKKLETLATQFKQTLINERLAPATLEWNKARIEAAQSAFRQRAITTTARLQSPGEENDQDFWSNESGDDEESDSDDDATHAVAAAGPAADAATDSSDSLHEEEQAEFAAKLLQGITLTAQQNQPVPTVDPEKWFAFALNRDYFSDPINVSHALSQYVSFITNSDDELWPFIQAVLPENYVDGLIDQAAADNFLAALRLWLNVNVRDEEFGQSPAAKVLAMAIELAYWGHSTDNGLDLHNERYAQLRNYLSQHGIIPELPNDAEAAAAFATEGTDALGLGEAFANLDAETDEGAAAAAPPPPPAAAKPALENTAQPAGDARAALFAAINARRDDSSDEEAQGSAAAPAEDEPPLAGGAAIAKAGQFRAAKVVPGQVPPPPPMPGLQQ